MSGSLAEKKPGFEYTIASIEGEPFRVSRLQELGFIRGQKLLYKSKVIFGEPLIVEVRGTQIALRKVEAECIRISE